MKRRSRYAASNPLTIWAELAMKTSEMWWASGQVIAHRTARMAAAGPQLSTRDRREFTLMGQEKLDAAAESMQAMATQAMKVNALAAASSLQTLTAGARVFASMTASPGRYTLSRHMRTVQIMTRAFVPAPGLRGAAARVAHHGLKPIHSRAVANAKRLSKL